MFLCYNPAVPLETHAPKALADDDKTLDWEMEKLVDVMKDGGQHACSPVVPGFLNDAEAARGAPCLEAGGCGEAPGCDAANELTS